MPYDRSKPCLSKNPIVKQLILEDPHSTTTAAMEARRVEAQKKAMSEAFLAKEWDSLDARASTIFKFATAADTQNFLDVVKFGLTYANDTLAHLTTKHSAQLVKTKFASTYIAICHNHGEILSRKGQEATEAEMDKMVAYYKEINEKGPILGKMKNREIVYGTAINSAGNMKGKLETVERVAGSLLAKHEALGAGFLPESVKFLTVAMKCIDSAWVSIHSLRLGIAKEMQKEEKVRMPEFVGSMRAKYEDGSAKKMTAMVEKDEVIVEDEA